VLPPYGLPGSSAGYCCTVCIIAISPAPSGGINTEWRDIRDSCAQAAQ